MVSRLVLCNTKSIFFNKLEDKSPVINKDLSFFLLKKRFFLYKDFVDRRFIKRKVDRRRIQTEHWRGYGKYIGPNLHINNIHRSVVDRLRSKMKILYSHKHRRYRNLRIKKHFKQRNRDNRKLVIHKFDKRLKQPKFTSFVVNTKNFPKKLLFSFLKKKHKIYNSASSKLFSNDIKKFLKSNNTGDICIESIIISRTIQLGILRKKIYKNYHQRSSKIIKKKRASGKVLSFWDYFIDLRQLKMIDIKNPNVYAEDDSRLLGFNFFNFRTYN